MSTLPVQKRTSVKIMPIQGRNQVISLPHGMLMFNNVQYVIPAFLPPSFDILVAQIGVYIGQTAGAALLAGYFLIRIHSSLLTPIFSDRITMENRIPKTL